MTRSIHSNAGVVGRHINAGRMGEPELAIAAPRVLVSYWCARSHETVMPFATTARVPPRWECSCGQPAGQDRDHPPAPESQSLLRYPAEQRSHLSHVKERRSPSQAADILAEALDLLHERRRRDEVSQPGQLAVLPAIHANIAGPVAMGTMPPLPSPPSSA